MEDRADGRASGNDCLPMLALSLLLGRLSRIKPVQLPDVRRILVRRLEWCVARCRTLAESPTHACISDTDKKRLYDIRLDPEGLEIMGLVWLGDAAATCATGKDDMIKRPSQEALRVRVAGVLCTCVPLEKAANTGSGHGPRPTESMGTSIAMRG
jgi:hypothetical protein